MGAGLWAAWRANVAHGTYPRAGGWADQSLVMLTRFYAISLIEDTWRFYRAKNADLNKLTRLQLDLIAWLENDNG